MGAPKVTRAAVGRCPGHTRDRAGRTGRPNRGPPGRRWRSSWRRSRREVAELAALAYTPRSEQGEAVCNC